MFEFEFHPTILKVLPVFTLGHWSARIQRVKRSMAWAWKSGGSFGRCSWAGSLRNEHRAGE